MNSSATEIEQWLIQSDLGNEQEQSPEVWDVHFDEERQLVFSDFGPYQKLYLRPKNFIKRFYHTLYPLYVEDWLISDQIQLYDNFCTIDTQLDIRFQATLEYAERQMEILPEINEYIKTTYHKAISEQITRNLLNLQDDSWVRMGLGDIEKAIELAVNELLVLEYIQAQTRCTIRASFIEFPDVQLGREGVYLSVLKKSFEVSEEQREERFRQQQEEQQQQLAQQQKQLEQSTQDAELDRQKQAHEAEHQLQLLRDQEQQQQEKFAIETRLHEEKTQHDNYLNDITLDVEIQAKQERERRIRNAGQKSQEEELSHKEVLKELELQAEIKAYESEQVRWLEAKDKAHVQQLERERHQKQLKFDMEVAYKKHEEKLQLEMQEQNYNTTKNSDIYLRREIELLELDKKRLELQLAIQESRKMSDQN